MSGEEREFEAAKKKKPPPPDPMFCFSCIIVESGWPGVSRPSKVQKKKKKAYNTCCSQAVTHPGTEQARRCLTSVIGREPVCSAWYGRRQ